jgi:hypothetical protein
MTTFKLGRNRPAPGRAKLRFSDYVNVELPPPPPTTDYSHAALAALSQVYLNDQLGDCVIAGGYHIIGTETGNAGAVFLATPEQITADYSAIGEYVPGDSSTDNGCDEGTALDYWTNTGFADGSKLAGHLSLDPGNHVQVQQAIYLFENCLFGVELPDAWISPFPSANGFTWDVGTANPSNGHCFVGVGYNATGIQICTWGLLGTVTWAAVSELCSGYDGGQLYVVLSPDQLIKASLKAPNGFDFPTLQADLAALPSRGGLAKS